MKCLLLLAAFLSVVSLCPAQEAGAFGLTAQIGSTSDIGLIYHPSGSIGIIPFFSVAISTTDDFYNAEEVDYKTEHEGDHLSLGGGVNLQHRVAAWEQVSAYVGVGGSYLLSKSTTIDQTRTLAHDTIITKTATTRSTTVRAYFGVQYMPVRWLAAYVNIGAGYRFSSTSYVEQWPRASKSRSLTTSNSGVGVVLYF